MLFQCRIHIGHWFATWECTTQEVFDFARVCGSGCLLCFDHVCNHVGLDVAPVAAGEDVFCDQVGCCGFFCVIFVRFAVVARCARWCGRLAKPHFQCLQHVRVEFVELELFEHFHDVLLVHLRVVHPENVQVDYLAAADAAVAVVLCKVGEEEDEFVFGCFECVAAVARLCRLRGCVCHFRGNVGCRFGVWGQCSQLPTVVVVCVVVLVVGRDQALVQLDVEVRGLPDQFVVAFALECEADCRHYLFNLRILVGFDQDVCVAHEAVFGFRVQAFQCAAFEGQVVDAVLVEGCEYFADRCHLVFAVEHLLQVDLEHLLHHRVVFWDAAQDCAGVGHRRDLVAADFLVGFLQVEVWGEG